MSQRRVSLDPKLLMFNYHQQVYHWDLPSTGLALKITESSMSFAGPLRKSFNLGAKGDVWSYKLMWQSRCWFHCVSHILSLVQGTSLSGRGRQRKVLNQVWQGWGINDGETTGSCCWASFFDANQTSESVLRTAWHTSLTRSLTFLNRVSSSKRPDIATWD